MNTTQIKCFLALAETLNFTRAAARVYISQPAFSRQISTLERELNCQLFVREKSVRLTPAGAVLAGKLGEIQKSLDDLIIQTQSAGRGYSGTLTIGVLEGQELYGGLANICHRFMETYPNIDFRIMQGSFGMIRNKLSSKEIDIAITLEFDVENISNLVCRRLETDQALFAISKEHPLAEKKTITLQDIAGTTLLLLSREDCHDSGEIVLRYLRQAGFTALSARYAPNISTVMLWVKAGLGVGMTNSRSALAWDPKIRLITEAPFGSINSCMVWLQENLNPAIALFDQQMEQYCGK